MISPAEAAQAHDFVVCEFKDANPGRVVCAWCKRIASCGVFIHGVPRPDEPVTFGICCECRDRLIPTNGGLIP